MRNRSIKKLSPQHQPHQPGIEHEMHPPPKVEDANYKSSGKLKNKVALITGGDSGIGRATAILFAKEGAKLALLYLNEHKDARATEKRIRELGAECLLLAGDIAKENFCKRALKKTIKKFGQLNILVNNAAEQHVQDDFCAIKSKQLESTFRTNIFSMFYITQAALPYLHANDTIINTTSVTAYRGSKHLIDYAATKGAIVSFTRSLALALVEEGIRVNGVAPGPVWTPLIPASFPAQAVKEFGSKVPMQRAAQPAEIAPCYVFLATTDSSYMTGQILHPNGGEIVGG